VGAVRPLVGRGGVEPVRYRDPEPSTLT